MLSGSHGGLCELVLQWNTSVLIYLFSTSSTTFFKQESECVNVFSTEQQDPEKPPFSGDFKNGKYE